MLDEIHPRTRVPLLLEDWDPDVQGEVDAALVVLAARRRRRPRWRRCASAACGSSTCRPTSGSRDPDDLRGLVRPARRARPVRRRGLRAARALPRASSPGADLVANPGCYPTAALLALAPLARAGAIADVVIDAKSGVSGRRPRRRPTTTHFISADENMTPYKVERHRHTPEIEQELAVLGATLPITFTPHLVPLAQGELVSCYVTPAIELGEGELAGLYRDAYEGEPWVEVSTRPARRARGARDQLLPHLRPPRRPHRPRARVLRDRQPVEGRGVAGGAEPQPDVRARRDARG